MSTVATSVGNHAVHIGLIGAPALLLLTLRLASRRARGATLGGGSPVLRGRALPIALAALSASAGLLHATVIREHYGEYWLFGAFVAVAASMEGIWGARVLVGGG